MTQWLKKLSFCECVLYLSLFFVGVFHVYLSCVLSIILLVKILIFAKNKRSLNLRVDLTFIAISVLVLSYAVATIWAVDKGTAILGFLKFLPLPLYMLVFMQESESKGNVLFGLPYVVGIMTVVSVGLMYIPSLETYFAVSGRLSGFVQYPNTFAIILLVSELLLITRDKLKIWDLLCIVILLFGILYTGSRTVFLLAGISNFFALIFNKNKKVRLAVFGGVCLAIAAVLLYCFITDSFSVIARYLTIDFAQSTFIGRLLYAQDAWPIILKHPFGLGYLGYYFIEQSIQTGVYSVMFVHNDFLQILLDVGWIPLLLFVAAIVMSLLNKETGFGPKLILLVFITHSFFDFDLQYIAVFMVLLLLMNCKSFKTITLKCNSLSFVSVASVLLILCVFFGVEQAFVRFGFHDAARTIYNHDTVNDMVYLKKLEDLEKANVVADEILERNPYVSIAYSAKAKYFYSCGDFRNVIAYKNKAIESAPFSHLEYWEYGYMLVNGIGLYENIGDVYSAEVCKKELVLLSTKMDQLKDRVSKYGKAITDQPVFSLPKNLCEYIETLEFAS